MQFGERLKKLRKEKGLNQQEVADRIGVSLRAYASYETKNIRPRKMETYKKLADVLGCNVNELLVEDHSASNSKLLSGLSLLGFGMGMALPSPFGEALTAVMPIASTIFELKSKGKTFEDWSKEQNALALKDEKAKKKFSTSSLGIILTVLGKKGIKCRVGEIKDLVGKGSLPDDYIIVDSPNIDEWWFVFWSRENRKYQQFVVSEADRAYMLFVRFGPTASSSRRKASIVTDDEVTFSEICKLRTQNSYRGNLTAILIDTENSVVRKEILISSFELGDDEDKLSLF